MTQPHGRTMRITELDSIRGIALVTILLNHFSWFAKEVGYRQNTIPTLTYIGYSSAAEMFFILSGYLVGHVYMSGDRHLDSAQIAAKLVGRALFLMAVNCLLFVSILALCHYLPMPVIEALRLTPIIDNPTKAAFEVVRLGHSILLGDVLNAYILMMLLAALVTPLLLHRPRLSVALIAALWAISQTFPQLTLPGGQYGGDGRVSYNPLAWQVLFLGGMLAGKYEIHLCVKQTFSRRRNFVGLMIVAAGVTASFLLDRHLGVLGTWLNAKVTLGPIRLLHAIIIMLTLLALIYRFDCVQSTTFFRALTLIGRQSLQCFVVGVMLNYAMVGLLYPADNLALYLAMAAGGVLALLLFAVVLEAHNKARKGRWRGGDKRSA